MGQGRKWDKDSGVGNEHSKEDEEREIYRSTEC